MATQRAPGLLGLDYIKRFTEAHRYRAEGDDRFSREIRCEDVQFPAVLVDPRGSDWLAGKRLYPEVGYSVQYGGLGYYADFELWDLSQRVCEPSAENLETWEALRTYWRGQRTEARCMEAFSSQIRERLPDPYTGPADLSRPAYALFRMAGLQLDYGKLLTHGIPGLERLVDDRLASEGDSEKWAFLEACMASLRRLKTCIRHWSGIARQVGTESSIALADALDPLEFRAPATFHESLQLVLLVSTVSGTINFGRLDVALGPVLSRDLDTGRISWEHALTLMENFYTILEEEIWHFDARIILGGAGRPYQAEADRFALLAMETTDRLNLPMPQVTLRFSDNQDPALLERAYEVVGHGKSFPMLYNDAVNIPAVEKAFNISREEAEQYLPFGCGEYMIDHRSCDTPNAIINLQRCLESAINHGLCLKTGLRIGPDFGSLEDYENFEALWFSYRRTVEYFLEPLAQAQATVYEVTGRDCPYSLVSLLYDDCLSRGQPIFDGGVRYLGGTNETYGNTNAADSLLVIDRLLFRDQSVTAGDLLDALKGDWEQAAALHKQARALLKYGNDDEEADAMLARVHEHVCLQTSEAGKGTGLHHFLVVVINNNHNTLWGRWTSASADGRRHGNPLAPGNAPGAGCDRSGLSAVLNSQARLDPGIHAGAVQNVRISASLPSRNPVLYRAVFDTYFQRGGTQAMISVTNHLDLLAALEHPENYSHLLVRVGGFSARFVDLDKDTQLEIISRTEHG